MFINSPVQVDILNFLERVGPSPCPALEVLFGKRTQKHLHRLRGQRYVYNLTLNSVEFWIPQEYGRFNPKQQELLTWFVARWEQGGGKFENNMATSPNGMEFVIQLERDRVILSSDKAKLYVLLNDLKENSIKDCLHSSLGRTEKPNNADNGAFDRMKEIRRQLKDEADPAKIAELQKEFEQAKLEYNRQNL